MFDQFVIREEYQHDAAAIRHLLLQAFESSFEADVVDALRESCPDHLSLVALRNDEILGHILFTPVLAREGHREKTTGMGLAPMAVLPVAQRQGIGGALIQSGMQRLRALNCKFVVVLGHPAYYPRFGFQRASSYGMRSEFDGVPDEAFMVCVLDSRVGDDLGGIVSFRPEFTDAM